MKNICERCGVNDKHPKRRLCLRCINDDRNARYHATKVRKTRVTKAKATPEQIKEMKNRRNEYYKKYVKNNPEKVQKTRKKSHQKRSQEIKDQVFAMYGDRCACCGSTAKAFFQLDHVLGQGAGEAERRIKRTYQIYRDVANGKSQKENYQILCGNCHLAKTRGVKCPCKDEQNED